MGAEVRCDETGRRGRRCCHSDPLDSPLDPLINHQINNQHYGIIFGGIMISIRNYIITIPPCNYAYNYTGLGMFISIIICIP